MSVPTAVKGWVGNLECAVGVRASPDRRQYIPPRILCGSGSPMSCAAENGCTLISTVVSWLSL